MVIYWILIRLRGAFPFLSYTMNSNSSVTFRVIWTRQSSSMHYSTTLFYVMIDGLHFGPENHEDLGMYLEPPTPLCPSHPYLGQWWHHTCWWGLYCWARWGCSVGVRWIPLVWRVVHNHHRDRIWDGIEDPDHSARSWDHSGTQTRSLWGSMPYVWFDSTEWLEWTWDPHPTWFVSRVHHRGNITGHPGTQRIEVGILLKNNLFNLYTCSLSTSSEV